MNAWRYPFAFTHFTLKQVLRAGKIVSVVLIGGSSLIFLHKHDYDVSNIGITRLGRAGLTCSRIFIDYKWSLRRKDIDAEEYADIKSSVHWRSARRLLKLACANGGVWIKVGQHIGTLEYLLPDEYVTTMKVLHKNAPQASIDDVKCVIREDLKQDAHDLFVAFDEKPVGAASLAQVHKATTVDGRVVAVKVQHRRVKAHSYVDMATMEVLVSVASWLFPEFRFGWLVQEMRKNLPQELNFQTEGHHAERVGLMYAHLHFLKVPKIHWDLTTDRVLVMEFCEGSCVNDMEYYKKHDVSTYQVCKMLAQLYSEMIFVHGYVHCDPHPGNVLVNKDPQHGTQLVLLDHGLYTSLTNSLRLNYAKFWLALLKADLEGIKTYATALGVGDMYGLFACMVTARSWTAVKAGIKKQVATSDETDEVKIYVGTLLPQISEVLDRVPREMLLILKTNDLLRSIEFCLKTQGNGYSFLYMTKCCVRAVRADEYAQCTHVWSRAFVLCKQYFQLAFIRLYELWLGFRQYRLLL